MKKWSKGDRVRVKFGDEFYSGEIQKVMARAKKPKATVIFDDGEVHKIDVKDLELEKPDTRPGAFETYDVKWDEAYHNFAFKVEDPPLRVWGAHRRTKFGDGKAGHAVDLWVEASGEQYALDSLAYQEDPRRALQKLNADLCAAVNVFIFREIENQDTLFANLKEKAERPLVEITKLGTLDELLLNLETTRITACKAGGERLVKIRGDKADGPEIHLRINLTSTAIGLKGKVPSKMDGARFDGITGKRGDKGKGGKSLDYKPSEDNVKAMCRAILANEGSPAEQKKLRASLRKMGHKGGVRAVMKKLNLTEEDLLNDG